MAEAVEKLFLSVPNERLIRDIALKRKNDSMKPRFRFVHCVEEVVDGVVQHGVTRGPRGAYRDRVLLSIF